MKPWAELTAGERGVRLGGIAVVIAAILAGVWTLRDRPEPPPAPEAAPAADAGADSATTAAAPAPEPAAPQEQAAAEPAATPEPVAEATPEPAAEAPAETTAETTAETPTKAAPTPKPPMLDVVRVTRDGSAVIAGAGLPGSTLSLRVDGAEVVSIPADAMGNFVGMFNLPPSEAARQLAVVMILPDGTEIPAEATIAIAPTVAPVLAAATEGNAEPTPAAPESAPAALMVTDEGAKVLQGIGDADLTAANVTIDAITYTPEGAVQLAGRGTAGAGVRLYLDNAAAGQATIDAKGGWSVTLGDVAPGLYTLRADQIDGTGKVTARFETPFQRESLEALAAASGAAAPAAAEAPATEPAATEPTVAETAPADTADTAAQAMTDAASTATTATEPAPAETPAPVAAAAAPVAPVQVTVQPGWSLWRIARENLGEGTLYVQVFEANKAQIRDPDLIYPGQIFTLPGQE